MILITIIISHSDKISVSVPFSVALTWDAGELAMTVADVEFFNGSTLK